MIDIAATIAKMEVCGMSADQIVMALKAITPHSEPVDDQAERRRAADRERKATARLRKSAEMSADNGSKKEISHTLLEKTTTIVENSAREEAEVRPVSRGTRLPDDFAPLPNVLQGARNLGFSEPEIQDQLERFRDWANAATGQVAIKRDWNAALRNWVKRASDEKKHRNARRTSNPQSPNSIADGFAAIHGVIDEIERREQAAGDNGG